MDALYLGLAGMFWLLAYGLFKGCFRLATQEQRT